MPQTRHLSNAPITEAIFDFRVRTREGFDPKLFISLKAILGDEFPKVEEPHKGAIIFRPQQASNNPVEVTDLGIQGYFYKNANEDLIAQFRVDGFTLNKLKPYTSWDELLPIALRLWKNYCNIANPIAITRIALRYINNFPIEAPKIKFTDYLLAPPNIPDVLPQRIGGYFSRITLLDEKTHSCAHVVQSFEPLQGKPGVNILFDIDAFKEIDIEPDNPIISQILADLRNYKNMIFFNYLTDNCIRMFE